MCARICRPGDRLIPAKIREWKKGDLAEAKLDGRKFIKREHLDDFIASHCNEA